MTQPTDPVASSAHAAPTLRDRALLVGFWLWAVTLFVATLAQLFHWSAVLDALDVKRWFAR
jgi:hypothetical protein